MDVNGAMGIDPDLLVAAQDYQKLARTHVNAGFREGVEEGKREVTERGFTRGFREGALTSLRRARLSGRLSALEMFLQQERGECLSQELSRLKDKIERLGRARGEEVSGDGEGGETRELWEVCEQADGSDYLVESEQKTEDALNALEKLLQTPKQ